jgi:raffinose/stachyose/melibiose transport system substrate-binding protein
MIQRKLHLSLVGMAALGLLVTATGCTANPTDSGPVTITVVGTTDTQTAIDELVASFSEVNPDITVETVYTPTDSYVTTVPRTLTGSNSPDVAIVFPGPGEAMQAGGLLAAGAIIDQSDFDYVANLTAAQKPLLGVDGSIGFNPMGYDTIGVIYNERIFEENGLSPVETFSEFKELCTTLSANGIVPVSLGLADAFVGQFMNYALIASTVYVENPDFDVQQQAGEATFADSGWVEAMEKQIELRDAGCFGAGYSGTGYEQMLNEVGTGVAAMTVTVGPSFPGIRAAGPDDTFAMFPLPAYDDVEKNGAPQALSVGFGISANSANPDAAKLFVDFANLPENATKFAASLGVNPLDPTSAPAEGFDLQAALINTGRTGPFANQWWPNQRVGDVQGALTQGLFADQNTVADLLTAMDEAYAEGSN